ncbi:MAG: 4Fe-4S dicluster domain-containing protein [Elusimicrobia bacterium]|nr:4Fe-4S dicluster domain-containing protein [Elusimicrobiota bacterium]
MNQNDFAKILKKAGVVGAGGAGFPAYVKASSKAEFVIVNAAECEPLLRKDQKILEHYPEVVFDGLEMMMMSTSAKRGIIGIKKKHAKIIEHLKKIAKSRKNIEIKPLGDCYPAGDEFCLVYDTIGKLVPMGGLPINVGVVVSNVETLYNAAKAYEFPVTEKFLTVAGSVKKPCTFKAPIGISYGELIEFAGGAACNDYAAIDGGPMMGKVIADFSLPLTKVSGGLIVLPKNHSLILKKSRSVNSVSRMGKSACDQCSFCTELCPRYLLGHILNPHRVMRSLLFSGSGKDIHNEFALLCSECSLCSLYSCPENLDPKSVCDMAKQSLIEKKINLENASLNFENQPKIHPLRDYRKTPVSKLISRLNLLDFNKEAPFIEFNYIPKKVKIMLNRYMGASADAIVNIGQAVKKGDIIASISDDKLGAYVHASIDGKVSKINQKYIEIEAK